MTPERFRQVDELYHAALDRDSGARAAFITQACDGDDELRREVESLLAQKSGGPLDRELFDNGELNPGTQLGPYRIEGLLGAGGMGRVYKARDTRLGRAVAIKVASARFSQRFQREARAISALNHPHICTLYDIGPNYLVMEFVEGELLSKMIECGPLPLDKALTYAVQIVDALAAAHARGVIHRDLKPSNIIITINGVKVLDFGLAKLRSGRVAAASGDNVETVTDPITRAGAVLGTPYYMAPEQVEGKEADERSDIFSFGVVLYEMIAGRRPFIGDTQAAVLAALLKDHPPPIIQQQPSQRQQAVPRALERVVRKCLEKKPDDRWQSARDLKPTLELVDLNAAPVSASSASVPTSQNPSRKRWLWRGIGATALLMIAAGVVLWAPWRKPAPTQAVRFDVGPSEKMTFINNATMTVSPDGRWMVFPAWGDDGVKRYYLRALDGTEVRALPGTELPTSTPPAWWSYDSRSVVFTSVTVHKLRKVDIQGGPPEDIADFPGYLVGASWNADDVIIASSGPAASPILRVPAAGGEATPITALAPGESTHAHPQFLPDGRHFLYQKVSSDAAKSGVYIGSLDVKPEQQSTRRLLASNRQAYYAPAPDGGTGHLIFLNQTTLMAQPFNPDKMALSGEAVSIAIGVGSYAPANDGLFSVSKTGTLVYRGDLGAQSVLTWFDQQGNPAGTLGEPGEYAFPAISPDGSRVAVAKGPLGSRDIWILDVARGSSTRFTFGPANDDPAWSPDGRNIVFDSNRGGQWDIYIKAADGSGEEKLLLKTDEPKTWERWTKDGRFLLFDSKAPKTAEDIWALPFAGEAKPVSLLRTRFREMRPVVSPDGRWMAYTSDESGPYEVYVRPFTPEAPAGTGAKWMVSKGGGEYPLWRPDGKELFYSDNPGETMAVDIDTSKGFQAGTPRRLFTGPSIAFTGWDLSLDGKRFLFVAPPSPGRVIPFTVVLNWQADLKH